MKIELDFNEELTVTRWDAEIKIPRTRGEAATDVQVSSRQHDRHVFDRRYKFDEKIDDPDMIIVSVRKGTPQEKASTTPEDARIKHIISCLVHLAKKERDESRPMSTRSKNKAISGGIGNAYEMIAAIIQSGEIFETMPEETKKDA